MKDGVKTSEFYLMIALSIAGLILAYTTQDDSLKKIGETLVEFGPLSYILSRGIAKAGKK